MTCLRLGTTQEAKAKSPSSWFLGIGIHVFPVEQILGAEKQALGSKEERLGSAGGRDAGLWWGVAAGGG